MMTKFINKIIKILFLRNPVDVFLGRIFFGNDSSFRKNLQGKLALKNNRISSKINISNDSLYFKKNGFVKAKKIVPINEIQKLREKFIYEISCVTDWKKNLRYDFTSLNNPNFFKKFSEVKNIFNDKMCKILEDYYNGYFKVTNVHIYRIIKNQNSSLEDVRSYGSTIAWHNDGSRSDSVKIFVALDKIDENSGPMEFVSKKETKNIFRKYPFIFSKINLANKINNMDCKKKMTFFGNEAYFINTNLCLHRAQSPNTTHRDLLVYYCQSSKSPFNFDWEKVSTENIY